MAGTITTCVVEPEDIEQFHELSVSTLDIGDHCKYKTTGPTRPNGQMRMTVTKTHGKGEYDIWGTGLFGSLHLPQPLGFEHIGTNDMENGHEMFLENDDYIVSLKVQEK